MRIILYCIVFLVSLSTPAILTAQVEGSSSGNRPIALGRNIYGLGLSAGVVDGFGVSFRHHLPSIVSYQVVGGIINFNNTLQYNVGGELQVDIMRGDYNRFFAAGGAGYFFSGEGGNNTLSAPGRFGLGIGNEWSHVFQFHITAEMMLTFFNDGIIVPTPQVSAHYYFF